MFSMEYIGFQWPCALKAHDVEAQGKDTKWPQPWVSDAWKTERAESAPQPDARAGHFTRQTRITRLSVCLVAPIQGAVASRTPLPRAAVASRPDPGLPPCAHLGRFANSQATTIRPHFSSRTFAIFFSVNYLSTIAQSDWLWSGGL
jgi:hypothetical protein